MNVQLNVDMSDPNDITDAIRFLKTCQKKNADDKVTDTPEPEPIITQETEETQQLFLPLEEISYTPGLDEIMESLGLSFTDGKNGGSSSSKKIACRKHIEDNLGELGLDALMSALSTIKTAWPSGRSKWNWLIIQDVWTFYKCCHDAKISTDTFTCARCLSNCPRTHKAFSEDEFINSITEIPGEATLERYNYGFHGKNKIPKEILIGGGCCLNDIR